jgi:uncharacterized protein
MPALSRPLLLALAFALQAGSAQAKPPLWVVRDADSELVIFGSVHLLPPDLDWRPGRLDAALQAADDLWFETPVDARTEAQSAELAGQRGFLPPDQSLFAILAPRDAQRLLVQARRLKVAPETLQRMEPWLAELTLTSASAARDGATSSAGVEKTIAALAPSRLALHALETPQDQLGAFDQAPRTAQIASLRQTLDELERRPNAFAELIEAWMRGDLKAVEREHLRPLRRTAPVLYKRLVVDRNARWTAALQDRLKGSGRSVVVVGFGHLVGADGLPAKLRALGYSVEGP